MVVGLIVLTACSGSDSTDVATTEVPTSALADDSDSSTEGADETSAPDTSADAETTTTTEAAPTTTTTTTEAPETTTEAPETTTEAPETADVEAICAAYLEFATARTPEDRSGPLTAISAALGDETSSELVDALATLSTADFGSQDVRPQQGLLSDFVLPKCDDQYRSGLSPAADDETAAAEFYAALVAGDRAKARTLADALTVAKFEPWEASSDPGELVATDAGFWLSSIDFRQASCDVSGGLVTRCGFG
jgi:hypothetical protein